jgi:hypothetical protein
VDVSIEMLAGLMAVLFTLLLVFEATTYWHARNVFDEAAAEGARVAAAYESSCPAGVVAARNMVRRHAGRWSSGVTITCSDSDTVIVAVSGRSPGIGGVLGIRARAVVAVPKER